MQAAFETQRVLRCSERELEQLLVAANAETIADPAARARTQEMSETIRSLLVARSRRPRSRLALAAFLLALAAVLWLAVQSYSARRSGGVVRESAEMSDYVLATKRDQWWGDPRMQVTIEEMARRAPSLSKGTLQAWWAGEQARQVQFLEEQAKRQMIVGDREGALLSVQRADAIRRGIEPLANFERPPGG